MDKITINNIFSKSTGRTRPLTVQTLFNPPKINKYNRLDVDSLLKVHEDRHKKVLQQYERIYEMCSKRIRVANNLNKSEIIYEVPTARFMCPGYKSEECLKRLEKGLDELYMDTMILNSTSIFISWKNMRQNRIDRQKK